MYNMIAIEAKIDVELYKVKEEIRSYFNKTANQKQCGEWAMLCAMEAYWEYYKNIIAYRKYRSEFWRKTAKGHWNQYIYWSTRFQIH